MFKKAVQKLLWKLAGAEEVATYFERKWYEEQLAHVRLVKATALEKRAVTTLMVAGRTAEQEALYGEIYGLLLDARDAYWKA